MPQKPPPLPKHAHAAFSGKLFTVYQWNQELYDGSSAVFEAVQRPDTALAVGVLPEEKVLLTLDHQPHREPKISSPGGRIEPGESPQEAIMREFEEETGYTIGTLVPWFEQKNTSKVINTTTFYIARDLIHTGNTAWDAGEKIELRKYTFDAFLELAWEPTLRETELRVKLLEALASEDKKREIYRLMYE